MSAISVPPPSAPRPVAVSSLAEYQRLHAWSLDDPEAFWREQSADVQWHRQPDAVLAGVGPEARWFPGGELNLAANALDRHIAAGRGQDLALLWVSEALSPDGVPLVVRRYTWQQLRDEVARVAAVLHGLGVRRGDIVTISLPVVPELPIAMLACAWIGAVHNVVFAGFPAQALADRITGAGSRVVVTADGGWRAGKAVPLKPIVDEAIALAGGVERILVLRHNRQDIAWDRGRDVDWHAAALHAGAIAPVPVPSDHPLFIMYTSGSTGRPKGILHGTAGYLMHTLASSRHAFDLRPGDLHWCTADPAWITGHTYTVYGPLLAGAATLLYEGHLGHPGWDRAWAIIERYRPRTLYTTPTLIRAWIRHAPPAGRDLSSLRLLGSVGEPLGEPAWRWLHRQVGGGQAPIVDTWWQTEAGAAMLFNLPYAVPSKPGSAGLPFFGIAPGLADADGRLVDGTGCGQLVITRPWPGQALGIRNDPSRWLDGYWRPVPGAYATGDTAARDADGHYQVQGRVDDVIKINGHRLGTAEVEGAIAAHGAVAEAAAVGVPDERSGEALVAFIVLRAGQAGDERVRSGIIAVIEELVGKLARPRELRFVDALPKNRSGKILRRLLRELVVTGRISGDLTTIEDAGVLASACR